MLDSIDIFSFNPYRVFSSAETDFPGMGTTTNDVSIPIGFSHQLRRRGASPPLQGVSRFNPYRVFSSAETSMILVEPN